MTKIANQVKKISEIFINIYIAELSKKQGREGESEILRKIFEFQDGKKTHEECEAFIAQEILGKKDDASLTLEDMASNKKLIRVLEEFAKINDMLRRIRGITNQQFFDNSLRNKTADSFGYVLNVFADKKLSANQVQQCLNQTRFSTSTTSHPTNPNSVEYTRAAMSLTEAISDLTQETSPLIAGMATEIYSEIAKLIDTPIAGKKKNQAQEVEEGLLYLDSVYKAVNKIYEDFERAKKGKEGYENLELPDDVYEPFVWISGDGDGNPNSTEESLRYNIKEFKKRIKELYKKDIAEISVLKDVLLKLDRDEKQYSAQDFIKDLEEAKKDKTISNEEREKLVALTRRVKKFGFHYAKIDIRHEAGDIMKATVGLLRKVKEVALGAGITLDISDAELAEDGQSLTTETIQKCFNNQQILDIISRIQTSEIPDNNLADKTLTRRIFGRLRAIAENPDMSDKLIIAEFKSPANASAALFLLKAAGNEVCNEKARMNIVPLAEEKATLRKLPQDLTTVLNDEYLAHIKRTKKIYFMIAKSDTVRRDGIGAQEAQETAVKDSIKAIIKSLLKQGVSDLENYTIVPYNGGGHALQRGGGRLSELPAIYGRYAMRALQDLREEFKEQPDVVAQINKIKVDAPCFTVQGHQNYILFHPEIVGAGSLSSLASQALYAEAKLRDLVMDREVELGDGETMSDEKRVALRKEATKARVLFGDNATAAYQMMHEKEGVINRLFENCCWVSTKLNNKSSRASVRGMGESGLAEGTTFRTLRDPVKAGEKNKLLDQRAIGAEKLCAHSGLHLISWFSVREGLQAVKDAAVKGESCSLHDMYRGSKATRDCMRGVATSIFMVDMPRAWQMMVGIKRPDAAAIAADLQSYNEKIASGRKAEITPRETMAFLEKEFVETAKLVHETITGKAAEIDFDPQKILDKWPEIRDEIKDRNKKSRISNVVETVLTRSINQNLDAVATPDSIKLVESAYCGVDTSCNNPNGVMLTVTRGAGIKALEENETTIYHNFSTLRVLQSPSTNIQASFSDKLSPELQRAATA